MSVLFPAFIIEILLLHAQQVFNNLGSLMGVWQEVFPK